tara:strand:- start:1078 stop:1332 length:255 start_codon:yes stop_codon:yes gene_type:complete
MKILLENWRKLLEGDVIKGPWSKREEDDKVPEHVTRALLFEDAIVDLLKDVYGTQWDAIPIDVTDIVDSLVNIVENDLNPEMEK